MSYVWITKYALTRGLFKRKVIKIDGEDVCVYDERGLNNCDLYFKGDWHKTKQDAIDKAEEIRIKKLKSLDKQIKKISAINFE